MGLLSHGDRKRQRLSNKVFVNHEICKQLQRSPQFPMTVSPDRIKRHMGILAECVCSMGILQRAPILDGLAQGDGLRV